MPSLDIFIDQLPLIFLIKLFLSQEHSKDDESDYEKDLNKKNDDESSKNKDLKKKKYLLSQY